jgi:hypothetical protein
MSTDNSTTLDVPLCPLAAHFLSALMERVTEDDKRAANLSHAAEIHVDNFRNQLAAHLQRLARGA